MQSAHTIKQIILWRHADAEMPMLHQEDMARALTAKGVKQSRLMAKWLNKYLPKDSTVLVSPALRALQTAKPLDFKHEVVDAMKPGASLAHILAVLDTYATDNLMLIGHQPWIGELIAYLLNGQDTSVSVKKGAVWWLRLSSNMPGGYKLFTVQAPQLLD